MSAHADTSCRGCGTCCRKGGPALHGEDMDLLRRGALGRSDLVTLRAGELARDDAAGTLDPLDAELVKLAGARPGVWACRFLGADNRCTVYATRPVECGALLCRDTSRIMALYGQDRATRAMVLAATGAPQGWRELAEAHEERLGYAVMGFSAHALRDPVAREALLEAVRYDAIFRRLACDKAQVPAAELDFLFGRPLTDTIVMYGVGVQMRADGLALVDLPTRASA